tara:strand:+ start:817 stop:1638 length:822 start_codon:yes stop_codon:yes gene_type:complete
MTDKKNSWLEKLTHALLREPQNREHLLLILRDASARDILDADTLAMVEGVIRYSDLRVRDIMLPRVQIVAIASDASLTNLLTTVRKHRHSRYPIFDNTIDNIIGILHAKDLLMESAQQDNFSINDILRPAIFVPESKHLNILLTEFKRTKNHMAIVVDEYGGVSGFVTIENVIEQIIGDIEDEFDNNDDAFINKHANGRYIIKGHIPIEEFNDYFKLNLNTEDYETLAGLLIKTCEHLPGIDEVVTVDNYVFKILNADNRRIKLVEFTVKDAP